MGIQHWGAFGGFQKKTGALVGHWVNGQNVITAIPHPSQNPPTLSQLGIRAKFAALVNFLRPLNGLLKVGFMGVKKEKQSGFNAAFKENYPFMGNVSPFTIDYSKVVLSKGILAPADNPEVSTTVAGSIKFDWTDLIYMNAGSLTDKVTLVVYNPVKDRFVGVMGIVARSVETYTMQVPGEFSGDTVNCWISMVSADGKRASDSTYLGTVPVI